MLYHLYLASAQLGYVPGSPLPDFEEEERYEHPMTGELGRPQDWGPQHAQEVAAAWAETRFDEDHPERCEWYTVLVWPAGLPEQAYVVHLHRPVTYQATVTVPMPLHAGWEYAAPRRWEDGVWWVPPDEDSDEEEREEYAFRLAESRGALCLALEAWRRRREA